MNNIKTTQLDKIIERINAKFPYYHYINILNGDNDNYNLGKDSYTIVVEKIKDDEIHGFLKFVDDEIMTKLIENGEELPLIITMQRNENEERWKQFIDDLNRSTVIAVPCTAHMSAVEDYCYPLAA